MAAGVTIKHKRKASAFTNGQLVAGEWGMDTSSGIWYYSADGTTVTARLRKITTALTDAATVTVDASKGDIFTLDTPGGTGRTIDGPTGGYDGQIIEIRCKNSHGTTAITHTLDVAGVDSFRFPAGFNALPSMPAGTVFAFTAQYHAGDQKWDLPPDQLLPATAAAADVLTGTDTGKIVTPDALAALWEQGSDVASASTISLGEGGYFVITGTAAITDIDFAVDKAGRFAVCRFAGALTLTNGANLILPTGANITTAAGDVAIFVSEGGDVVRCVSYLKADGTPLAGGGGGGAGQMCVQFHADAGANATLTNQANAEQFLANNNRNIIKADLTNYTQVRLCTRVVTASASVNTPRIYLEYHTSFTTTVGTYSDIGTATVNCSLSATGLIDSGWIDLVAGAKADVFIAVLQNGGDGAADPALGPVQAFFR